MCQCLEGIKPKSTGYRDRSEGCVRNKALNYSKLDGFIKFNGLKLPDATNSSVNKSMNLKQCRVKCLENTSCMAYSNLDIRGEGSGCVMWFGDLIDIKQLSYDGSRDSGILSNGVVVVIVLGFVSLCKVLIVLARVSFEKSASMRSEKQLSAIIGVLGFLFRFLICSGVLSSVLDFDFGSVDGFGKFSLAVLMGCVVGFLYMPAGKNARSFWLGSDQLQSNLEFFSYGWFGRPILYVWKLWKEGKLLELIDPFSGESCNESEAIRCIHISLLCLEHQPNNRPSMSSVVLMLGSDNALPEPKQPGFLMDRKPQLEPDFSNKPEFAASNEVTISVLQAR
ncbi:hypothetical protein LWI29_020098 [Acer saccharum]|uniref:Apple domain-containing protein n=1 Tax=Acer saccharum TaxID=4024 RepID=A0AA39T6P2_ACESA|nr:hypothetical protein LWI29_020098 [Acer saccharum]